MAKSQWANDELECVTDWQTKLRTAMFDAVTEQDITDVMKAVVKRAKGGDLQAVRLLLSYAVGSANVQADNVIVVNPPKSEREDRIQDMARSAAKGKSVFKLG